MGAKVQKIAHNSHIYPKKFGSLEKCAYFCSIKYQKSEDKLQNRYISISLLNNMLTVGTSSGGRQPKTIIAINQKTGEIRSGQISGLKNYDYYH